MAEKKKMVGVFLNSETRRKLRMEAAEEDKTLSAHIRDILTEGGRRG